METAVKEEEFDIAAIATQNVERSKEELRVGTIDEEQFLSFSIDKDLYGIDIMHVKEILSYTDIARVPMTPDYIKGVMNLRGSVVPVIDLARRFHQRGRDVTRLTCIIVIEVEQAVGEPVDIGMVVDSVDKVVSIAKTNMEKSPEFGTKIKPEFLQFMGKVEESFVPVLNLANVLNLDELSKFDIAKEKFQSLEKKMKKASELEKSKIALEETNEETKKEINQKITDEENTQANKEKVNKN
ncbi:MAG: chemotaxis protein CheW [Spirochaetia bacterium]|nr:chemotaxis protein CheW [Spirochaetia bacterium]